MVKNWKVVEGNFMMDNQSDGGLRIEPDTQQCSMIHTNLTRGDNNFLSIQLIRRIG